MNELKYYAAFCVLSLCTMGARAQSVRAQIQPSVIALDQKATYSLVLEGVSEIGDFKPELPPELSIMGSGSGARDDQVIMSFLLQASTAGKYTIPAQTINLPAGQLVRTTPVQLEVRANPEPEVVEAPSLGDYQPIMNLRTAKTECYVGEAVAMQVIILLNTGTNERQLSPLVIERENFTVRQIPPKYRESTEMLGGRLYRTLTATSTFVPIKAGKQTFGPASMRLAVAIPVPSMRGGFAYPSRSQSVELKSGSIDMNVKPLPEEGKPADFQGAIGDFHLYVRSDATEARTGDPITITCVIRGKGNFDSLKMPAFPGGKGWKTYPAKVVEPKDPDSDDAPFAVQWDQVIIPTDNKKEIPPLSFSYFDPDKQEYLTLISDPIPMTITGEPMTEEPVQDSLPTTSVADEAVAKAKPEGLLGAIPVGAPLQVQAPLKNPLFWAAQALLALLLAGVVGRRWMARRATAGPDWEKDFRKQLARADTDAEFFTVAARWILWRRPSARADDPGLPDFVRHVLSRYESVGFRSARGEGEGLSPAEREATSKQLRQWSAS